MAVTNLFGDLALDASVQEVKNRLPQTASSALAVGNAIKKFRFGGVNDGGFINGVDPTEFDVVKATNDIMNNGGNSFGASYLRIVKSVFDKNSTTTVTSVGSYKMPFRLGTKISLSQRLLGQDLAVELVGVDTNGNIVNDTIPTPIAISGTITIASNVATVNFASAHGITGSTRLVLSGNTDTRLNVGQVYATVVSSTQITVPCTLANGTYTAGGVVTEVCPIGNAYNGTSELFDNATATNALFYTKRNGSTPRPYSAVPTQTAITSTIGIQSNVNPYTDAWNAGQETEAICTIEEVKYADRTTDVNNLGTQRARFGQTLPDEEVRYKIRLRANNLNNFTAPVARITAIAKTGTTTATVTTDVAHGLTTSSFVQIYGVRDITNFPNLTAQTQVASIVSPTQFTIVIGGAVTASSAGGVVSIVNGSVLQQGALNFSIQSISRTNNILTATLNTTASTALPGEYWTLAGMDGSGTAYIGAYKVLRVTGSTIEFESTGTDFGSITCGGAIIKNTEFRIHGLVMMDYTRLITELSNSRGAGDVASSLPVNINQTLAVSGTVTAVQGTAATISTTDGTGAHFVRPAIVGIVDVASAALTTTTTTAAISNVLGNSFQITIPVTAVTGTTPTMDIRIEESFDGGTNWVTLYDFQRITATGSYNSPILRATGRTIRYVQTLSGTTPSFTRAITRNILPFHNAEPQKRLFDRAINVNTLNTTSAVLFAGASNNVQLVVNMGAITTTAPQFKIQGSEDGANWYDLSITPLTAVASSTVQQMLEVSSTFVRAITSTAGSGATLGYLSLKSYS